jgi:type IV secretory pathway VirB2 component (pilin)
MPASKTQTIASLVVLAIGIVLMAGKIHFDSEPGAIPLALVLLGATWFTVTRVRNRRRG